MRKIYTFALLLIFTTSLSFTQSGFDPQEFTNYRDQIRNITVNEILEKYPAPSIYYSQRKEKSQPENFQYLDSIDLRYSLTEYEKGLLSDNHFMVTERLSHRSFANAFVDIYSSDLPLFLSTDFFLHALHVSYDVMLRDLEAGVLEPNLKVLLTAMRNHLPEIYNAYVGEDTILTAIEDVDLYLAIASSLLEDKRIEPLYDNSGNYDLILDAIKNLNPPVLEIGLFSDHKRKIDISQFQPRGHYTEEFWFGNSKRDLKDYFRAMMWLGRIDFMLTAPPVAPGGVKWTDEDLQRMSRGAVFVNQLLESSGKKDLFELHEKIIGFFVGPDDNLTPRELQEIADELNINPQNLSETASWNSFKSKIGSSDDYGQKIMSNFFIVDADKENPAELPVSYRFLGQKFLIDSYVFSEVVYDRVYKDGVEVKRMMPDPLDAMFVLGNDNALPLLENELQTYHYAYKLEELRYLTDSYDEDFWQQSLYNNWLNAIRELNPRHVHSTVPYFMKTTDWQLKQLNTQLSSWAELRHDNVLYAKQSYTGGTSCSFPYVYIEPYPDFFRVMSDFAFNAADFFEKELNSFDFPQKESLINFYESFAGHMSKLKILTEKELRQEIFDEEDISYLKTFINGAMASGPSINGWYNELFYDIFKGMEEDYLVVDVHTQPTNEFGAVVGKVLHVGTGNINLGVFFAGSPCNSYKPAAFVGPVMSFHTRTEENWKRLTNEEWTEFFWSAEDSPARPDWVNHYLASPEGKKRGTGEERNLKGFSYEGNNLEPVKAGKDIAYVIAFPNPAGDNSSLRFVLNYPGRVKAEIYNVLGRQVRVLFHEDFTAGEHKAEFSTENLESGLYFIRLSNMEDQKAIQLIVK